MARSAPLKQARAALRVMVEQGIVRNHGLSPQRVFSYAEYLRTLNEGTELPA